MVVENMTLWRKDLKQRILGVRLEAHNFGLAVWGPTVWKPTVSGHRFWSWRRTLSPAGLQSHCSEKKKRFFGFLMLCLRFANIQPNHTDSEDHFGEATSHGNFAGFRSRDPLTIVSNRMDGWSGYWACRNSALWFIKMTVCENHCENLCENLCENSVKTSWKLCENFVKTLWIKHGPETPQICNKTRLWKFTTCSYKFPQKFHEVSTEVFTPVFTPMLVYIHV